MSNIDKFITSNHFEELDNKAAEVVSGGVQSEYEYEISTPEYQLYYSSNGNSNGEEYQLYYSSNGEEYQLNGEEARMMFERIVDGAATATTFPNL